MSGRMVRYISPCFEYRRYLSRIQTDPPFISQTTSTTGDLQNDLGRCFPVLTPAAILQLLEFARSLVSVNYRCMKGTITRKGTAPALDRVFKEAAAVCMCSYRRSMERTTGPERTSSEIGIAQIQDITAEWYVPSFLSFFSSFLRTPC